MTFTSYAGSAFCNMSGMFVNSRALTRRPIVGFSLLFPRLKWDFRLKGNESVSWGRIYMYVILERHILISNTDLTVWSQGHTNHTLHIAQVVFLHQTHADRKIRHRFFWMFSIIILALGAVACHSTNISHVIDNWTAQSADHLWWLIQNNANDFISPVCSEGAKRCGSSCYLYPALTIGANISRQIVFAWSRDTNTSVQFIKPSPVTLFHSTYVSSSHTLPSLSSG